MRSMEAYRGPR